jgi:hypothetical protein
LSLLGETAHAQTARTSDARVTISVGLLELFPPSTVSLITEVALGRRWSVAAATGFGLRSLDGGGTSTGWTATLAPRWYVLGHVAEGLHVGWTLTYARAVEGALQGDLQPPAGASTGPVVGYETTPFPAPLVLGVELGILHAVWLAPEAGAVSWLVPSGDVTAGVVF